MTQRDFGMRSALSADIDYLTAALRMDVSKAFATSTLTAPRWGHCQAGIRTLLRKNFPAEEFLDAGFYVVADGADLFC